MFPKVIPSTVDSSRHTVVSPRPKGTSHLQREESSQREGLTGRPLRASGIIHRVTRQKVNRLAPKKRNQSCSLSALLQAQFPGPVFDLEDLIVSPIRQIQLRRL